MTCEAKTARLHLQVSMLSFRTQFIVAGPGLVPWMYDSAFLTGMADYLGPGSGVSNLTIKNWAEVNLANFPVSALALPPRAARHVLELLLAHSGLGTSSSWLQLGNAASAESLQVIKSGKRRRVW